MRKFAVFTILILALWSSAGGVDEGKKATAGAAPKVNAQQAGAKVNTQQAGAKVNTQQATSTPPPAQKETPSAPPKTETPPPKSAPPAEPKVKVTEKVEVIVETLGVVAVKIGIVNSDTRTGEFKDLNKSQKLSAPLALHDLQDRLNVKISTTRKLHQVFVLLRNKVTDEEVGFIGQVEAEGGHNYKVDVDLGGSGFEAGTYEIVLYLGDFLIEDSLEWVLGDVNFKVTSGDHQPKPRPAVNPLYSISYDEKAEIKHQFRQPEPRPPKIVSDAFTLLVLSPLLILFILWIKIGINISNFPFTLSALAFHLGLTALFGVYTLFWIKLSMFEALKWMGIPALVTFIAGNRLLNYIAERRSK